MSMKLDLFTARKTAVLLLTLLCALAPFQVNAQKSTRLPAGNWTYDVYSNDSRVGTAYLSRSYADSGCLTNSEISFRAGEVMVISKEKIAETSAYLPVSFSTMSTFVSEAAVKRVEVNATVKAEVLTVEDGTNTLRFKFTKQIYFGTNQLLVELLRQKMKVGSVATKDIYDPSVDPTRSIPISAKVVGLEKLTINKKEHELYKIEFNDPEKKVMTLFIDAKGVFFRYLFEIDSHPVLMDLVRSR